MEADNVSSDARPQHYPAYDGTGCECNNYESALCIASCAANIRNHEVRYQYGKGAITVTCSRGNFVLGCNIKPHGSIANTVVGRCLSWAVKSVNSCECYSGDVNGAVCYAVCGQMI